MAATSAVGFLTHICLPATRSGKGVGVSVQRPSASFVLANSVPMSPAHSLKTWAAVTATRRPMVDYGIGRPNTKTVPTSGCPVRDAHWKRNVACIMTVLNSALLAGLGVGVGGCCAQPTQQTATIAMANAALFMC